jgi:glycosyltransferase involved in cell wall biosynthesis
MSRAARFELEACVRHSRPDVIFVSALRNVDGLDALTGLAPLVRYVHDHTLFCPGLNKFREDGELCHEPLGLVCIDRYFRRGGCICFKQSGFVRPFVDPLRTLAGKWRELEVTQRAARVLTNSHYMRAELLQVGFHPERTSVLCYFTQSNTPAQPQGPLPDPTERFLAASGAPLVFTPARLTLPDKGVDYLLSALARLTRPFRAVVAGSGPAEAWLREKARAEGLGERVHFTGWLDGPAIETLYARADLVVCPSVWDEPFGLVGIESMAHGKPVIAFRVGGIPEWLADGESGFLVERKDVAAMAAAVERLLASPPLAARFGARGRALVAERFPRQAHLAGLEAALAAAAG